MLRTVNFSARGGKPHLSHAGPSATWNMLGGEGALQQVG